MQEQKVTAKKKQEILSSMIKEAKEMQNISQGPFQKGSFVQDGPSNTSFRSKSASNIKKPADMPKQMNLL